MSDFLSQMQPLWDQLALSEPTLKCIEDAKLIKPIKINNALCNSLWLFIKILSQFVPHFFIVVLYLRLKVQFFELISEETSLSIGKSTPTDTVLVVHSLSSYRLFAFHRSSSNTGNL